MSHNSKSYLLKLSLFMLAYTALFVSVLMLQMGTPTETSRWTYEVNQKKINYAKATYSRKILLVAGSNTLFGLRAKLIQKTTGIKTVNMGVNTSLGIQYILDNVKALAKPGDMIVMPLEYGHYNDNGEAHFTFVDYIFSRDPDYFYHSSMIDKIRYALVLKPSEITSRIMAKFYPEKRALRGYQSSTINTFGDETINNHPLKSGATGSGLQRVGLERFSAMKFPPEFEGSAGSKIIAEFSAWCKQNHITLLAAFPAFMYFPSYNEIYNKQFFQNVSNFYKKLDVPVLGNPYDFMYPRQSFYDSQYHLTGEAADRMTRQMIVLMKPYILQQVHP